LELGRQVERGEVLVELDSEAVRRDIEDKAAERAGLVSQLERIRTQIEAQTQALGEARSAESAALNEARAEYDQAEAAARLAEEESSRIARVHAQGLVSEAESDRARAEAQARRANSEARLRASKRLQMDRRLEQSEKQALVAELERQRALLEARTSSLEAVLSGLAYRLDQHRVRAPVAGSLGEVVSLQPGAVVAEETGWRRSSLPASSGSSPSSPPRPGANPGRSGCEAAPRGFPWVRMGPSGPG
jgi:membrane fusion protein (multidrug efflux system)